MTQDPMGEPFIHLAGVQKVYRTRGADFLAVSEATFDVEVGGRARDVERVERRAAEHDVGDVVGRKDDAALDKPQRDRAFHFRADQDRARRGLEWEWKGCCPCEPS